MQGGSPSSGWLRLGLVPLGLASSVYRAILSGHRACYTYGVRRAKRLPCCVISIGNLTLGGTGKTPLTIWLARWAQQHGWRVAVLSRGYGARATAPCLVVSVGEGPLVNWRTAGDEPYLLAGALPGVPVIIGKDRYSSGRYACEHLGAQLLILDDGFQHVALQRHLDVVLVDATNPFGCGGLVPRGILREPVSALRRADAIFLTRADLAVAPLPQLYRLIRRYSAQPIYTMTTVAEDLLQGDTPVPTGLGWLRQRRVVAFAGIGNPDAFSATLAQLGTEVMALLVCPDHHPYTEADWRTIVSTARQQRAECLLTTEKDAVRLAPHWRAQVPVFSLRVGVRFGPEQPLLQRQLQRFIGQYAASGTVHRAGPCPGAASRQAD
ncbi:Tetraacyldisaccharide 4'-kinase [Candidatus Entotheonellaceae bacterium PAL068K]